jgi:hypothetical protein
MVKTSVKKTSKNKKTEIVKQKIKNFNDIETKYINQTIKKYNTETLQNLAKIGEQLYKKTFPKDASVRDKIMNEFKLQGIKYVINRKRLDDEVSGQTNDIYNYYPNLTDKDFNLKIYRKKEFNDNRIKQSESFKNSTAKYFNEKLNDLSHKSRGDNFKLTESQVFLKNYMSPNTPYNGVLIFHSTGVGKTCTTVSIVEQYKQFVTSPSKKMIILTGETIRDNFKNEIFKTDLIKSNSDFKKYKTDSMILKQCTKNEYLRYIDDFYDKDHFKSAIDKIRNQYYEMKGYIKFGNEIVKEEFNIGNKLIDLCRCPENNITIDNICEYCIKVNLQIRNFIKKKYSNRILIIDEAHNIRKRSIASKDNDSENKEGGAGIEKVLKYADNMKLILLTATPMYDKAEEIAWLLNLLLINDKRFQISKRDLFRGNILNSSFLRKIAKGYISFRRGENPIDFPFRLYPENEKGDKKNEQHIITKYPKISFNGLPTAPPQYLKIIGSTMKKNGLQYKLYKHFVNERLREINTDTDSKTPKKKAKIKTKLLSTKHIKNEYDEIDESELTSSGSYYALSHISNMVFPVPTKKDEDLKLKLGTDGFSGCFDIKNKVCSYSSKLKKEDENFLHLDKIGNYSAKIKYIIECINKCDGICFIYSTEIKNGLLPLALALEQNGYEKYGGNQLNLSHREYRSYDGSLHKNPRKTKGFKQANYIMITGDPDYSDNKIHEIKKARETGNEYGKVIKVILGSSSAAEGIDLKWVREIHILEPWFNLTRTEQVIGRGIRYRSHLELPLEKRNVTVYYHAAVLPEENNGNDIDTVDIYRYKMAEYKAINIGKVERELKRVAVDCNLNKYGNIFNTNQKIKMVNARGKDIILLLKDRANSHICNYLDECDYECDPQLPKSELKNIKLDTDTYSYDLMDDDIYEYKVFIKNLFKNNYIYSLDEINEKISEKFKNSNHKIIYYTLSQLVNNNEPLLDMYDRMGHIIYRGKKYVFQPNDINNKELGLKHRIKPLTYKNTIIPVELWNVKSTAKNIIKAKSYEVLLVNYEKWMDTNGTQYKNNFKSFIKTRCTFIAKVLAENGGKSFDEIRTEMFIDKLAMDDLNILLENIVYKMLNVDYGKATSVLKPQELILLHAMKNHLLITNIDKYKIATIDKNNNTIFGYKLIKKSYFEYYIFEGGKKFVKYDLNNNRKFIENLTDYRINSMTIDGGTHRDISEADATNSRFKTKVEYLVKSLTFPILKLSKSKRSKSNPASITNSSSSSDSSKTTKKNKPMNMASGIVFGYMTSYNKNDASANNFRFKISDNVNQGSQCNPMKKIDQINLVNRLVGYKKYTEHGFYGKSKPSSCAICNEIEFIFRYLDKQYQKNNTNNINYKIFFRNVDSINYWNKLTVFKNIKSYYLK